MNHLVERLVEECRRQEEDCLYTAVSFHIWLRWLRSFRGILWGCGAASAALAATTALKADPGHSTLVALASLGAVAFPAMVKALKLDDAVSAYATAAARLANLRAASRQAAEIWFLDDEDTFRTRVEETFEAMAAVRSLALTPPEICFRLARRKVNAGHYRHETDA